MYAEFLATKGEGLHHVAVGVGLRRRTRDAARARGARVLQAGVYNGVTLLPVDGRGSRCRSRRSSTGRRAWSRSRTPSIRIVQPGASARLDRLARRQRLPGGAHALELRRPHGLGEPGHGLLEVRSLAVGHSAPWASIIASAARRSRSLPARAHRAPRRPPPRPPSSTGRITVVALAGDLERFAGQRVGPLDVAELDARRR